MGWGDELMVTGQARAMQARDPRKVLIYYERGLRWHDAYNNNPRIATLRENGNFQLLKPRINGCRPYMVSKSHEQWVWRRYEPERGELYFSAEEKNFGLRHAGRIILEPHIKPGASPNKQWGWVRWNKLAWLMGKAGLRPVQMGSCNTPLLDGVEQIHTHSMRMAAAVMSQARAAVLPEGGLHHTAAVFGVPSVVIYGGFISPEVTGYAGQTAFFRGADEHPIGCGMRVECQHCARAMASITPEEVVEALLDMLRNAEYSQDKIERVI